MSQFVVVIFIVAVVVVIVVVVAALVCGCCNWMCVCGDSGFCVSVFVCVCMRLARTRTSAVNSVVFVGVGEFGQQVNDNDIINYTIFDNELCTHMGYCVRLVNVSLI